MFTSIFDSAAAAALSTTEGILCLAVSVALGFLIAMVYRLSGPSSKSFAVTLTLLPALVQVVITMVNGNLGAGVAVMGAFGLVRFRSVPGNMLWRWGLPPGWAIWPSRCSLPLSSAR